MKLRINLGMMSIRSIPSKQAKNYIHLLYPAESATIAGKGRGQKTVAKQFCSITERSDVLSAHQGVTTCRSASRHDFTFSETGLIHSVAGLSHFEASLKHPRRLVC